VMTTPSDGARRHKLASIGAKVTAKPLMTFVYWPPSGY
jgi:hypothetical protein